MADAVVIGAGPNGLVGAILLADAGWSVTVLEAEAEPGGAVRSGELVEPGFVNDWCSAFYPLGAASPVLSSLDLGSHGLRWLHAPLVLAHPSHRDGVALLSRDLEEQCHALDRAHPGDGAAWRALHDEWRRLREPMLDALLGPFPPVRAGVQLAAALRRDLARFARFAVLPVRRLGEERFAGPSARRLLAGLALHADLAPEAALSGMFGWLLAMTGQDDGFPVPEGGAGALTAALVSRLRSAGGEVVCGQRVTEVVVRGGRAVAVRTAAGAEVAAERAVLADVDAPTLFWKLVAEEHLPAAFRRDLANFHWDHATCKVDWTLDAPVPWCDAAARRAGTVHLVDSVDDLTLMEAQLVTGHLPQRPFVLVGQQSMTDPTRQPPGTETLWAYTHLPHRIVGDGRGELDGCISNGNLSRDGLERFADRLEHEIEGHAPGFRALVRGRRVSGPGDLAAHDANLVDGAIAGGTGQLHQQVVFRPVPGSGRPTTPVAGLYLASSSAHPGGGVHGACGANAARAALAGHRVRRLLPAPAGGWLSAGPGPGRSLGRRPGRPPSCR